jgi:hypothetical protein
MPESTPVTRSRLPFIAIAVWVAILAAVIAVGLAFGGRGATNASQTTLGAGAPNLTLPLTADPSASPGAGASTAPGKTEDNDRGPRAPGVFAFGRGGGPGRGRGPISITAISGSQLSLKTDDGWTRTIDATGAAITEAGGAAIGIGDLKVGDQVGFRETRNTDGTYKITEVVRIPPQAGGTVKSVDGSGVTVTLPDGTTKTIALTGSTTFTLGGKAATPADLKIGTRIHAIGTVDSSGTFTATKVDIEPAQVVGIVTGKTATTITVKDPSGASVTINVDASTTYQTRGKDAASLADVALGDTLGAQGTLNSDGSLHATAVRFGTPGGFAGPGKGRGFGHGRGAPANPASPEPSGSAG